MIGLDDQEEWAPIISLFKATDRLIIVDFREDKYFLQSF